MIIYTIIICILTIEALLWAQTIYSHCIWYISNGMCDRRKKISSNTLCVFSLLSGILTFITWMFYIYIIAIQSISIYITIIFYSSCIIQLITIHSWYIISIYNSIEIEFIPFMSRKLSNFIYMISNKYGYMTKFPIYSVNSNININEINSSLVINFIKILPDMFWYKDIDNRFLFVNKSTCVNLLYNIDESCIIGKTSTEIANDIRKMGINYTFGELCYDSDEVVKKRRKPTLFYEYGYINGKFIAIQVLKTPVFDNNIIVGTIGIAKDISMHINNHEKIHKLFKNNKYEEGVSTFLAYKQQFESMEDIKNSNKYVRDDM